MLGSLVVRSFSLGARVSSGDVSEGSNVKPTYSEMAITISPGKRWG